MMIGGIGGHIATVADAGQRAVLETLVADARALLAEPVYAPGPAYPTPTANETAAPHPGPGFAADGLDELEAETEDESEDGEGGDGAA